MAILRGGRVIVPQADDPLEAGDELLFVATAAVEEEIRARPGLLSGGQLGAGVGQRRPARATTAQIVPSSATPTSG